MKYSIIKEIRRKRRVHGCCELVMTTIQARKPVTHEQQHHGNAWGRRKKGATCITRRDTGRGGTSPGISRRRRKRWKKEFNYPTQRWKSKHQGGHQVAWVTKTHNNIQSMHKCQKILLHSVSYYSPLPLEALHPPCHPTQGIQITTNYIPFYRSW